MKNVPAWIYYLLLFGIILACAGGVWTFAGLVGVIIFLAIVIAIVLYILEVDPWTIFWWLLLAYAALGLIVLLVRQVWARWLAGIATASVAIIVVKILRKK